MRSINSFNRIKKYNLFYIFSFLEIDSFKLLSNNFLNKHFTSFYLDYIDNIISTEKYVSPLICDFLVKLVKFKDNNMIILGIGILLKDNLVLTSSSILRNNKNDDIYIYHNDKSYKFSETLILQKSSQFLDNVSLKNDALIEEILLSERNFSLFTFDGVIPSNPKNNFKLESLIFGYNNIYLKNNVIYTFTIISLNNGYLNKYENVGVSKENVIYFNFSQKDIMLGSPVYICNKQILVGIITYISSDMMIAYKFDDIKKINQINLESLKEKSKKDVDKMNTFIKCYQEIERIEKLNFINSRIEEIYKLSSLFKFINNLKFLNISRLNTIIYKEDLFRFLINIIFLRNLEHLSLNQCCIDDKSFDLLIISLQHLFNLKVLLLRGNAISDVGVLNLVKIFDFLNNLNELDMTKNSITKIGMKTIDENKGKLKKLKKFIV